MEVVKHQLLAQTQTLTLKEERKARAHMRKVKVRIMKRARILNMRRVKAQNTIVEVRLAVTLALNLQYMVRHNIFSINIP